MELENIFIIAFNTKQKMLNKNAIRLFYAFLFLLSTVAPSISTMIGHHDDTVCVVDLMDLESKEKDPVKDKENKILDFNNSGLSLIDFKSLQLEEYCLHNYATPHLNLSSPPPEQYI